MLNFHFHKLNILKSVCVHPVALIFSLAKGIKMPNAQYSGLTHAGEAKTAESYSSRRRLHLGWASEEPYICMSSQRSSSDAESNLLFQLRGKRNDHKISRVSHRWYRFICLFCAERVRSAATGSCYFPHTHINLSQSLSFDGSLLSPPCARVRSLRIAFCA